MRGQVKLYYFPFCLVVGLRFQVEKSVGDDDDDNAPHNEN